MDIFKLIAGALEDRFSFGSNAWNSQKIPLGIPDGGCVALTLCLVCPEQKTNLLRVQSASKRCLNSGMRQLLCWFAEGCAGS